MGRASDAPSGAESSGRHAPRGRPRARRLVDAAGPVVQFATKYFAWGWCQMIAEVVCSGWSWKPSETLTPMRPTSSRSATFALSSRSGQAG